MDYAGGSAHKEAARPRPSGYVYIFLFVVNAVLLAWLATWNAWSSPDWALFTLADPAHPYRDVIVPPGVSNVWRFSPVALWVLQPLAIAVGQGGFVLLHLGALALLPRRTALLVAISFPFWVDLVFGNVFIVVFVAAYWAVRGNRAGIVAFTVLTLLMPRPLQLPLMVWILWREPWFRLPFIALFLGHAVLVAWSGLAPAWADSLTGNVGDMTAWYNSSPSHVLGVAWLLVGVPLAAWLFYRGKPLWAGLAMSPYLLPQYWLFALDDQQKVVMTTTPSPPAPPR